MPRHPSATALLLTTAATAVGLYLFRDVDEVGEERSGGADPLRAVRGSVGASPDAHLVARPDEPEWVRVLARWTPPAPQSRVGRLLSYLWASPSTLGGLVVGLLSLRTPTVRDGVLLFADVRGLPGLLLRRGGFAATTLGHVVIARVAEPTDRLMAHELAHTRQAERLGPAVGPVYWYLLARYGYARHPMERAARIAGRAAQDAAHTAAHHDPGPAPATPRVAVRA